MSKRVLTLTLIAILSGCAQHTNINQGTPFSAEQASQIVKHETTANDLLSMLGNPAMKSVISENEEKWVYSYTTGQASAKAFTVKVEGNLSTHTLDILLKDGVVINFTNNVTQQKL